MKNYSEVIILGAGAAGLFCASQAAKLGKQVTLLDNGKKIGRKILMSGGGFCNFTNLEVTPQHYLSQNPHFVKSALARYTQWDFIAMVAQYGIAYHEKELGQLFTDEGAEKIVEMLAAECANYQVNIQLRQQVSDIHQLCPADLAQGKTGRFSLLANGTTWYCDALVIATGGLSMPGLGATPFGYQVAEQFGIQVLPPRASLVPFTWRETDKFYTALSGISLPIVATANCGQSFNNQMLFTHRGISGPAILQISNYWQPNESIEIDLLPDQDIGAFLQQLRTTSPKLQLKNALSRVLPKKLVELWLEQNIIHDEPIAQLSKVRLQQLIDLIHHWSFLPNGTEGYRTAEVTMGGVDTHAISSKTMQSQRVKGLYFIGEVLDVTGWLGGYNFQWAWSSAYACAVALGESAVN
ncbi:NAD(P)/FAD-dependent oxidoreductase [Bisgaard Taxon 45]